MTIIQNILITIFMISTCVSIHNTNTRLDNLEKQLTDWHCTQVNTQHKPDEPDTCVQFSKGAK